MQILVVGAGYTGSCAARYLAESGFKVTVIDKRAHIGGNAYDELDDNGVLIHSYGPHMFFTDDDDVMKYVKRFSEWVEYKPFAYAVVDDKYLSMPFNNLAFKSLLGEVGYDSFYKHIKQRYGDKKFLYILDMIRCEDEVIKDAALLLYEKDFLPYNIKQWGLKPSEIDFSVTARIPVRLSDDCQLKDNKYQVLPKNGFTAMFSEILNHENIELKLNTPFDKQKHYKDDTIVLYTGMIDAFFDYCYGKLPYRTLMFKKQHHDKTHLLKDIAIYYPSLKLPYTRQTDYSYLPNNKDNPNTVVISEYPQEYLYGEEIPFYVVLTEQSKLMYNRYKNLASGNKNLFIGGRLGDFRYYNMDDAIKRGLNLGCEMKSYLEAGKRYD